MTVTLEHPRYHFDRWIAAGGMGEVWQATDTLLEREVAVKVLRRELAEDPVLRARFAAEARHAGALQHPHVASVLDYGEITGAGPTPLPFLVMELVDGQPLSALLAEGNPLDPRTAADLIAQAAEGIEAAHAIGIVHRDVKPGNLLVTADGQVKVTDFGVARAADTASLTMTGHLIGTPHYISPEQAEGASATPVSDVYSLGIVLYETLTGRKPFAGDTPVVTAVMHIREPLPPFPDSVPVQLQRITQVATAKDPSARFRSAGAMAAALRDESPDTRTYLLPGAGAGAAVVRHRELMSVRRMLGALVAVLLLAGGLWAVLASTDDGTATQPAEASAEASTGETDDRVRVPARKLRGLPVDEARRLLKDRGLRAEVDPRPNPGGRVPGTVAEVSPTGLVEPGSRISLAVWSDPPPPVTPTPAAPSGGTGDDGTQDGSADGPATGTGGTQPGGGPGDGQQGNGQGNGPGSGPGTGPGSSQGSVNGNAGGNGGGNAGGNGGGQAPGNPGKGSGKGGKR